MFEEFEAVHRFIKLRTLFHVKFRRYFQLTYVLRGGRHIPKTVFAVSLVTANAATNGAVVDGITKMFTVIVNGEKYTVEASISSEAHVKVALVVSEPNFSINSFISSSLSADVSISSETTNSIKSISAMSEYAKRILTGFRNRAE